MQDALAQAVAVFAPEKIGEQLDDLRMSRDENDGGEGSQTPLSQEDFERINGRAGKGSE